MVDLIYTDKNGIDIDILHEYSFDLAYGSDENNFELTVPLKTNLLQQGYFVYIDGTEYGGIVDSVSTDTSSGEIIYAGRTWHGILCGKVVEPDRGYDYLYLNGEANEVIAELIERCNLSNVFTASTDDSGFYITNYPARYNDLYTVLTTMLMDETGKLKIIHKGTKTELSAIPYIDYSQDEEWDSSQRSFKASRNYRPVNHLICLGGGNLKNRHVIHLFADENGGVQPYSTVDIPVRDSQYVLTTDNQVLFDSDEVAEVYDFPNAENVENYIRMSSKPSDFDSNFTKYYQLVDDTYKQLEETISEQYTALTTQPTGWDTSYADYYARDSSGYSRVEGVVKEEYSLVKKKPSDWNINYSNYYITDGVAYKAVSGDSKTYYNLQTQEPSDWKKNYTSYFKKKKNGKGYENISDSKAPKWKKGRYYTQDSKTVAPKWDKNTSYYSCIRTVTAPSFVSGSYYSLIETVHKPSWIADQFYELSIDHYAALVEGGLEKMREYQNSDSISIELRPDIIYDIGDVVGASENVTGLAVWQPITKKIVTINRKKTIVSYEVGGK